MSRIREGTSQDVEIICRHRRAMFHTMGHTDSAALDAMTEHFRLWLAPRLATGEYRAWFVEDEAGTVVAGAGVWSMPWPPHMISPDRPRANILNVYTEPECRGRGLARELMQAVIEGCRALGIRTIILHASEQGKPLYESLGFGPTNEMRLQF